MTTYIRLSLVFALIPRFASAMNWAEDCFECRDMSDGNRYMCHQKETNIWKVACCEEGDADPECQPSEFNVCSKTFN